MLLNLKNIRTERMASAVVAAVMVMSLGSIARADMAGPHAIHETQLDGTKIVLYIRGDDALHWQEDVNGFTVVREKGSSGRYVYAKRRSDGHLAPTEHEVGKVDPRSLGLQRRVLPSEAVRAEMRAACAISI